MTRDRDLSKHRRGPPAPDDPYMRGYRRGVVDASRDADGMIELPEVDPDVDSDEVSDFDAEPTAHDFDEDDDGDGEEP